MAKKKASRSELHEILVDTLKTFHEMMRAVEPKGETLHGFLLKHGREFDVAEGLPKGIKKGKAKACFENAGKLAFKQENLLYVEGMALLVTGSTPFPVHHAWVVERGSEVVIDPTAPNLVAYHGIPFKTEFLKDIWMKSDIVSVLGNTMDAKEIMAGFETP